MGLNRYYQYYFFLVGVLEIALNRCGKIYTSIKKKFSVKVRPNQIWQGQYDAHSLIIIARSMVLPYLIGSYFSYVIALMEVCALVKTLCAVHL